MDKNLEKLCPKYNKELYQHFNIYIKPQERLNFPKHVPPVNFVFNKEKNSSHSIAFEDATVDAVSETRLEYKIPNSSLTKEKDGIRKRMLEKFLWKQMAKEVIDELTDQNQVEDYCTEYENNYYKDNFFSVELDQVLNENNHIKYPIYGPGSDALTIYSFGKHNQKNILHPFKKQSNFTTPMDERLSDTEWNK